MQTITRKIGMNRGRSRLWIEGKALTAAGFKHGDPWQIIKTEDGFYIQQADAFEVEGIRIRKISGKPDRPVIDILNVREIGALADAESVKIEFTPGSGLMKVSAA